MEWTEQYRFLRWWHMNLCFSFICLVRCTNVCVHIIFPVNVNLIFLFLFLYAVVDPCQYLWCFLWTPVCNWSNTFFLNNVIYPPPPAISQMRDKYNPVEMIKMMSYSDIPLSLVSYLLKITLFAMSLILKSINIGFFPFWIIRIAGWRLDQCLVLNSYSVEVFKARVFFLHCPQS